MQPCTSINYSVEIKCKYEKKKLFILWTSFDWINRLKNWPKTFHSVIIILLFVFFFQSDQIMGASSSFGYLFQCISFYHMLSSFNNSNCKFGCENLKLVPLNWVYIFLV